MSEACKYAPLKQIFSTEKTGKLSVFSCPTRRSHRRIQCKLAQVNSVYLNEVSHRRRTQTAIDDDGNAIFFASGLPQAGLIQVVYMLAMKIPGTYTRHCSTEECTGTKYCIVGNLASSQTPPTISDFTSGTGVFIWPTGYVLSACFAYYIHLAEDDSEPLLGNINRGLLVLIMFWGGIKKSPTIHIIGDFSSRQR